MDCDTSDPFLPRDPWQMLRSGDFSHVPMIHGYNLYDTAFMVAPMMQEPHRFKQLEEEWEEILPLYMFSRYDGSPQFSLNQLFETLNVFLEKKMR